MTVVVIEATQDQHLTALAHAKTTRRHRSEILKAIECGAVHPGPMILEPPACLQGMFVFDFLRQIPRVGATKVREINRQAIGERINLACTLGELTDVRRTWLVQLLEATPRTGRMPFAARPQG